MAEPQPEHRQQDRNERAARGAPARGGRVRVDGRRRRRHGGGERHTGRLRPRGRAPSRCVGAAEERRQDEGIRATLAAPAERGVGGEERGVQQVIRPGGLRPTGLSKRKRRRLARGTAARIADRGVIGHESLGQPVAVDGLAAVRVQRRRDAEPDRHTEEHPDQPGHGSHHETGRDGVGEQQQAVEHREGEHAHDDAGRASRRRLHANTAANSAMTTTSATPRAVASPTSSPKPCDTGGTVPITSATTPSCSSLPPRRTARRRRRYAARAVAGLHGRHHRGSRRSPGQKACATSSSAQAAATARAMFVLRSAQRFQGPLEARPPAPGRGAAPGRRRRARRTPRPATRRTPPPRRRRAAGPPPRAPPA